MPDGMETHRHRTTQMASARVGNEAGDLYFCVKNNGDVIGQDISDSTLCDVNPAVRANIKPAICPVKEEEIYVSYSVVHVKVEGKCHP